MPRKGPCPAARPDARPGLPVGRRHPARQQGPATGQALDRRRRSSTTRSPTSRTQDRQRPGRDAQAGGRERPARARGAEPPRRWCHLPGAGRGAAPTGDDARDPLDRRLRPPAPREDDGRAARRRAARRRATGSARRSSARTTCRRWPRVEQGVRALPVVMLRLVGPGTGGAPAPGPPAHLRRRRCARRRTRRRRPPAPGPGRHRRPPRSGTRCSRPAADRKKRREERDREMAAEPKEIQGQGWPGDPGGSPRARSQHRDHGAHRRRARPRRPSGSSTTPGAPTRSARSTRARRSWTGWSRSRSAASRSRARPPPASGATRGSTSSTRPATSTSPSRWSGRCASSTARSRCSTRSPGSSRRPRRSGGRPTSTTCRGCASSTRWTASAPTSSGRVDMIKDRLDATVALTQLPIGAESEFRGVVDLLSMRALVWDDGMGESYETVDIPARAAGRRRALAARARRRRERSYDENVLEKYVGEEEITADDLQARPARRHHLGRGRAGAVRHRVQEQGRAAAARRGRRLPPEPARRAAGHGARPEDRGRDGAAPGRRAVRRARVQDHERPLRRASSRTSACTRASSPPAARS